jgi:protein TonB
VLVLAAMGGYFGWSKMHSGSTQPVLEAPAPVVQETPAAEVQATPMDLQTAPGAKPSPAEMKGAPASLKGEVPATPGAKISSTTKPTMTVEAPDVTSKEITVADVQAPIVVKKDTPKPAAAQPAAAEAEAPVPGLIGVTSNTEEKALAGIVSAPVTVPTTPPQAVRISQGVSQGLLLKRVQPVYPQQALQMRVQGEVELEASISKDGSITKIKVLRGQPALAKAAVDAVQKWKYQPYVLNGEPVAIQTQITVNFKLP